MEHVPSESISASSPAVTLETIRVRLSRLWLVGSGAIFVVLIAQSIAGRFGEDVRDVWGWALPNLLPTLSLMLSIMGADALRPRADPVAVRAPFGAIAYWLSASYLALIVVSILAEPLTRYEPLELLKLSGLWLGPMQGLVASALGVLFFSEQSRNPRV
jgi:hypothetical protein